MYYINVYTLLTVLIGKWTINIQPSGVTLLQLTIHVWSLEACVCVTDWMFFVFVYS